VTLCSQLARDLEEDMAGTAPAERGVLVLEQPGPWGRDALLESPCPPAAAQAIAAAAKAAGLRVQVVRRSTRRYSPDARRAWLACVTPGERFLEALTLEHPERLLDLDLAGVAGGRPTGAGTLEEEPLYLACTHSTRDSCCARFGLPLARELTRAAPRGRVWHSSHLGGHRFAATMAILPHGLWLGRLPAESADAVIEATAAGRIPLDHLRGRAGIACEAQVAELAVRRAHGLDGLDDVLVTGSDGDHVHLETRDGRTFSVSVRREPTGRVRPLSCGPDAKQEDPGRFVVSLR
jgi:hypothetical protein